MNKTTRIIVIVLFSIVLLPTLFYSVYEISALDETEEMISQMYARQLDAILFSVNQYILDVESSRATEVENELQRGTFDNILKSNSGIHAIVVADIWLKNYRVFPPLKDNYMPTLKKNKDKIDRLVRYQSADYRKLEPVVESDSAIMILFVPRSVRNVVVGMVVHDSMLINDVIGKKLNEVAQEEFLVAVVQRSTNKT